MKRWYGCVGKIITDRGELDPQEAEELFDRLGVKLARTMAYNPEANGNVERQRVSTGLWRPSWKLVAAPTLCVVGKPNYAQFGNRVHAERVDVQAESDHANGADDLLMDRNGLERRDESGGVVSGADATTRTKIGGRGMSNGKSACGEGKEQ